MKKYMIYVYSDYYTAIIKYNGVKNEGWGDTFII